VKTILIERGKANMPAPAGAPARPVPSATGATTKTRRECRAAFALCSTWRAGDISNRGWSREFEDPIPLPRGRQLVTLQDAADYILKLPKAEQKEPAWQTAVETLIMAAEGQGPLMHAEIGMRKALNRRH
jgi:hypothetical protein